MNKESDKTHNRIEITKDTRVYDILKEYGDIADVMEVFGVRRVGRYSMRRILTRFLTVKRAAFVHRIPLDEFLQILHNAVQSKEKIGGNDGEFQHSQEAFQHSGAGVKAMYRCAWSHA